MAAIELTSDGNVNISFRMGTTQPVSVILTYFENEQSEGTPLVLDNSTFKFVAYDSVTGKSILTVPMRIDGNTASCIVKYSKKLNTRFAVVMTNGLQVTDMVVGNITVY